MLAIVPWQCSPLPYFQMIIIILPKHKPTEISNTFYLCMTAFISEWHKEVWTRTIMWSICAYRRWCTTSDYKLTWPALNMSSATAEPVIPLTVDGSGMQVDSSKAQWLPSHTLIHYLPKSWHIQHFDQAHLIPNTLREVPRAWTIHNSTKLTRVHISPSFMPFLYILV